MLVRVTGLAVRQWLRNQHVPLERGSRPQLSFFKLSQGFSASRKIRYFSSTALKREERDSDDVDVCIVGAGPAGLATAIKIKQLDTEGLLRVVVLEKAGELGAHTLSGAVVEPRAFKELFPDSEYKDIPLPPELVTAVTSDDVRYLTDDYSLPLPEPQQMHNTGKNFIVSLSEVVKYLGEKAEELDVEVYPGISVSSLLYSADKKSVLGVETKDLGVSKKGTKKDTFESGMDFKAKITVLAEGCRGSLTKHVMKTYGLETVPQTYGIGLKEVWEVPQSNFIKGKVGHSVGYPLNNLVYGGGFQYHFGDNLVTVGLVLGLDYENPWINPYQELQLMKLHPYYRDVLEGGKCIAYGARALNEGGAQSIPKLYFPGGVLVGASAGFMNVPKIKGSHTAMKSGMLAAENIYQALRAGNSGPGLALESYERAFYASWAYEELHAVRNVRPGFKWGLWPGLANAGLLTFLLRGYEPYTMSPDHTDSGATCAASEYAKIEYPKPDGKITFDLLTLVSRTGTYHDEDEMCHLRVGDNSPAALASHGDKSFAKYQGIEARFCPAGVYEYLEEENKTPKFQINSQNCIHCKTCDIKDPLQEINWTVPEGGDGPKYSIT